jgi:hypothetical protein
MADIYVDSNAAGAGTGANWANAYTTLAAAFAAAGTVAGDTLWVAHNHAETQASAMTITAKGTAASPCRVICVNSAGSVPPVSADLRTTATVTTTGANAISIAGTSTNCTWYGITFSAATGANTSSFSVQANELFHTFINCNIKKLSTNAASIQLGNARSRIKLVNTTIEFGNVADTLITAGTLEWLDTPSAIVNPVLTTNLFPTGNNPAFYYLRGVDLSKLTPGTSTIVGAIINPNQIFNFVNCKLGASVVVAAAPSRQGTTINVINCDSGDTNYRTERYMYAGTMTTETTTVRTGGASDGTTTIAWKIVPTANNERDFPFECFPISIWNETTGSAVTLTIEGTWGGASVPTTADIWMDVEYLGTSGNPLGDVVSGGPADILAAGTNHTASTETWGAGGTTRFKMSATMTPQEKGPITVYIKYAGATNTVWIDPLITVS